MKYLYGTFSPSQVNDFKIKLHKKLFWLLLYKDPDTKDSYKTIDFDQYFKNLMKEIDALNELLFYPEPIIEMCCKLQAAYIESRNEDFNYKLYRKLILDAHGLVDKIAGSDENDNNRNA